MKENPNTTSTVPFMDITGMTPVVIAMARAGDEEVAIVRYDFPDGKQKIEIMGDLDVDCDGIGGNPDHDPFFQPQTTLQHKGRSLNAQTVPFAVVPPIVCQKTKERVLGCLGLATNIKNGMQAHFVVGDIGPRSKVGEGSPELCERLGLSRNANHGGTSDCIIHYEIYPGVPAMIDGETYELMKYGG